MSLLLACSGAGPNGPTFLSMYQTLIGENHKPTAVSGVSAGGMLAFFASLHTPPEDENKTTFLQELNNIQKKYQLMQKHFLRPHVGFKYLNLIQSWFHHESLFRHGSLLQLACNIAQACPSKKLNIPLTLGVYNCSRGVYEEKFFDAGVERENPELLQMIVASASVPLLFPGVHMEKHSSVGRGEEIYRDGALGHEIPIQTIIACKNPVVIMTTHCLAGPPKEPEGEKMAIVGEYLMHLRAYEAMERDLTTVFWEGSPSKTQLRYPKKHVNACYNGSKKQLETLMEVGKDHQSKVLVEWIIERHIIRAVRINM